MDSLPFLWSRDAGDLTAVGCCDEFEFLRSCWRDICEREARMEAKDRLEPDSMRLPRCDARLSCCSWSAAGRVSAKAVMVYCSW